MREDGRIVGGEGWQEKVYNREEWKKLLRTARNRRILQAPENSKESSHSAHANGMNESFVYVNFMCHQFLHEGRYCFVYFSYTLVSEEMPIICCAVINELQKKWTNLSE